MKNHYYQVSRLANQAARQDRPETITEEHALKQALAIIKKLTVKAMAADKDVFDPTNQKQWRKEALSALTVDYLTSGVPLSFLQIESSTEFIATIKKAISWKSSELQKTFTLRGSSRDSLAPIRSGKVNGQKIVDILSPHFKGHQLAIFDAYFCNGQSMVSIGVDYGIKKAAVSRQIKRITAKIMSIEALSTTINDIVNGGNEFALNGAISEDAIIGAIDAGITVD